MARFPHDLQVAGAVAAFVMVKNCHHLRLPGRYLRAHRPILLRHPLGVATAGYDSEHLAELLNGAVNPLLAN